MHVPGAAGIPPVRGCGSVLLGGEDTWERSVPVLLFSYVIWHTLIGFMLAGSLPTCMHAPGSF